MITTREKFRAATRILAGILAAAPDETDMTCVEDAIGMAEAIAGHYDREEAKWNAQRSEERRRTRTERQARLNESFPRKAVVE